MRYKTALIITLLILSPITASPFWGVEGTAGWYQAFSRFPDELPFRSSMRLSTRADVGFALNHTTLSLSIPVCYTSASPAFNSVSNRAFVSTGLGVRVAYPVSDIFSLAAEQSVLVNQNVIHQYFLSFASRLNGIITLKELKRYKLLLVVPVAIEIRDYITAPSVGAGIRVERKR